MDTLALLALIFLAAFLFGAVVYWLSMRLLRAEGATWPRAFALAGISILIGTAQVVPLLALISIPLLIFAIRQIARTTFLRAAAIWLMQIVAGAVMMASVLFVVKPYVLEAFVVPTNSMAPTIIGWHHTGTCSHCGGALVTTGSAPDSDFVAPAEDPNRPGTCATCGKFGKSSGPYSELQAPDRILVNKLRKPQRWDVIEFRFPPNPDRKYVARLVGLPGETVFIEDGSIWVDGVKQPLPEAIGKWSYSTTLDDNLPAGAFGTKDNPWKLKGDECCTLGDFGWRAADSRFSGPVPVQNIEGVVTLRYWPPSRWSVLK